MGKLLEELNATLCERPAGLIFGSQDKEQIRDALKAVCNPGMMDVHGHPFFGKAEAEWAWPDGWLAARSLGLIEFEVREQLSAQSGITRKGVFWSITNKGREALADFREYNTELFEVLDIENALKTNHPTSDFSDASDASDVR